MLTDEPDGVIAQPNVVISREWGGSLSPTDPRKPTLAGSVIFRCKVTVLQILRAASRLIHRDVRRCVPGSELRYGSVVAVSETALWNEETGADRALTAGKIHNLRIAIRRMDGIEVPAGAIFSFWAQIGRPSRFKGYVVGRELREGCIIPTVGGGLCQLSNALYDAALKAGLEIVERHAHTRVIPGSLAETGRDATVFWNYVDLRFKSTEPFLIETEMDQQFLRVCFRSNHQSRHLDVSSHAVVPALPVNEAPHDCVTCGVTDCFRSLRRPRIVRQTPVDKDRTEPPKRWPR